jgi:hypothetical protein
MFSGSCFTFVAQRSETAFGGQRACESRSGNMAPKNRSEKLLLQCGFVLCMPTKDDMPVRFAFPPADHLCFLRYFRNDWIGTKRFLVRSIDQLAQLGFELFAFVVFHKNLFVFWIGVQKLEP